MSDSDHDDRTLLLLRDWHAGDSQALEKLLERDLPWLHGYVRQRLGSKLRERLDSMDVVQEAAMDVMRYGPRFVVEDHRQFRALLGKILENNLRDQNKWMDRQKRQHGREQAIESDTLLDLNQSDRMPTRPDHRAEKAEFRDWVRLAIEFLGEEDRAVIQLRQFEEKSFEEIGQELGIETDSARMRFNRALPRLGEKIRALRGGRLDTLLE